ncbi:MAG: hypothetical protein ACT4QC_12020 [Planctomycetaceae bacterium]
MDSKRIRRLLMLLLLVGGPMVGWAIRGSRGVLFGLAVSLLAVIWFFIEEKRLL